jgi:predicted dehydrogenase
MQNEQSRRALLRAAMTVPLAAVKGSAANSAVTVGLIGSGGRGTFDAGWVVENPNARLVALCDIFDDRIAAAKAKIPVANPKVYKNYHDLLASDVDAVIIATPVFLHPEHFEAAVKAGKNIYIEKPAGLDVAGCKRVIQVADSADRKLNITFGFQQRYGPGYRKAKAVADSGGLGKMHMGHAHWIKGAITGNERVTPPPTNEEEKIRNWHVWRNTFGDIIVETYVHGIDVLNWFLGGHPERAYGIGGRLVEKRGDIMDHCDVTLTYAGGIRGMLTGTQFTPKDYRDVKETFYGSKTVVETAREYWKHYRGKDDVIEEKEAREITAVGLDEFIQRIQDHNPENTAIRAAESTLTAIMATMAVDRKREVTWDEMMKA